MLRLRFGCTRLEAKAVPSRVSTKKTHGVSVDMHHIHARERLRFSVRCSYTYFPTAMVFHKGHGRAHPRPTLPKHSQKKNVLHGSLKADASAHVDGFMSRPVLHVFLGAPRWGGASVACHSRSRYGFSVGFLHAITIDTRTATERTQPPSKNQTQQGPGTTLRFRAKAVHCVSVFSPLSHGAARLCIRATRTPPPICSCTFFARGALR